MMNRLHKETSLYLRQHASNPVDWYPWGPEALAAAAERDVPIFLSIGYSACHWCHVMEHECFENEAIAKLMNELFVNVKVDREERPDLDTIYMTSHQMLNPREGGGWPLSVFLTPQLTPFYTGTYFPPDDRYGAQRPSFPRLLQGVAQAWQNRRAELTELGQSIAAHFAEQAQEPISSTATNVTIPGPDALAATLAKFKRSYDPAHGGFGTQPKFPHAVDLQVLLRIAERDPAATDALGMVERSLQKMARGGIYDQVGGGFARYSVDAYWLVPHFEKMLYDNALLAAVYTEAYQFTANSFYRDIATETLDYVLREMTSPCGGFYSAQDADSEGEEGKFYVWSLEEVLRLLGPELGELAIGTFGVTPDGNFEGHNIFYRARSDAEDAERNGLSFDEFRRKLKEAKQRLYEARSQRVWPGRDEKILTAWNGLMIAAFAKAGAAFGEARYIDAARRAADFVLQRLRTPKGRLLRTCAEGSPGKMPGYLEDYAYLTYGLLMLFEATTDIRYLTVTMELCDLLKKHYRDERGGYFFTANDHETLIARPKDLTDNATPSGNGVIASVLIRLAVITGKHEYRSEAEGIFHAAAEYLTTHPQAVAQLWLALDDYHGPFAELAVLGHSDNSETQAILHTIRRRFRPRQTVAVYDPNAGPAPAELPILQGKTMIDEQTTIYVCQNFQCAAPIVGKAPA